MAPAERPLGLKDVEVKVKGKALAITQLDSDAHNRPALSKSTSTNGKSKAKAKYKLTAAEKRKRNGELSSINFENQLTRDTEELEPEEKERRKKRAKDLAEARKNREANRLLIGVDFGTTHLGKASSQTNDDPAKSIGLAYAYGTNDPDRIITLTEWPGENHETQEKTPTKISYATENPSTGDRWGYQVQGTEISYAWFKLLLDPTIVPAEFDDPRLQKAISSRLLALPLGKTAKDVVTDYLGHVREYTMARFEETMLETALEQTPIRFVITVPATWSHQARQDTRECLIKSGFPRSEADEILVIDEPESAALSVIRSMENSPTGFSLKV
jgi:hypothetical protein